MRSKKSATQISAFDPGILAQFFRIALQDDLAGFEDVAEVRDFQREIGVLFHKQNGEALFAVDFDDLLENGFDEKRRKAEGRFIE